MGTRLVGEISVTLANPDKPADCTNLLAKLTFLEHTQLRQASIVAVWVVDLVAVLEARRTRNRRDLTQIRPH